MLTETLFAKVNYWQLEEAKAVQEEEEEGVAKGLPRPLDYDDYWYEADDGLWYNEYDDELEEGQFYEEIPEEEGYPKPDLTAVEDEQVPDVEEVVPEPTPTPQPTEPVKAKEAAKPSDPEMDAEMKAAAEAAKAAGDAAKNLLGGAMSFGGGLLGGLGGKPQQQKQQSGFGFGGLGGMMGGQQPKPAQKKEQPKPKPQMKKQEAVEAAPPKKGDSVAAQEKPAADKVQNEENQEETNKDIKSTDAQAKNKTDEISDAKKSTDNVAAADDGKAEAQDEKPAGPVSKQPSEDSKKSVTFQEEEEKKKVREERHINKTRTMRPKEKWEWAFSRIMKNLEVRVEPTIALAQHATDRFSHHTTLFLLYISDHIHVHTN